LAKKRRKK